MNSLSLRYTDERDKACGIAGMAITLVVCDGAHLLDEIDFDASPGSNMKMSNVFCIEGNPRMSAKVVWSQSLKDLRAIISMVLGNIACRRCLGSMSVPPPFADLRNLVREQSMSACALEPDEADALFDDCDRYVRRIFTHRAIAGIAGSVTDRLIDRRRLSATEIVEFLASMGVR